MCFSISDQKIIVGLVAALIGTEIGGHAQSPILGPEIQLTAEKYDFKPDTVTVKKGDHVRLVITAIDHDHGFKIEAFQINQKLPKGQAVTVEFMADQVGTFSFQCSQFCGLGHKKMKGKLVVK
jgi:heme/copper-type cytochrome/quinol oxidase subunit 2